MGNAVTRAKVQLNRVVENDYGVHGKTYDYEFGFVCSDKEGSENKKFWDATPNGEFAMRGVTIKQNLKAGQHYYIDLIEAPAE